MCNCVCERGDGGGGGGERGWKGVRRVSELDPKEKQWRCFQDYQMLDGAN